jgi:hypothetical protein
MGGLRTDGCYDLRSGSDRRARGRSLLIPIAAAAAFIVGDGYDPARDVAWLRPPPEAAVEIGVKVDKGASPGLISAFAKARKCVSSGGGTLNVRKAEHAGGREIGRIQISYGGGPEIAYWVARNTVRWTRQGRVVGLEH